MDGEVPRVMFCRAWKNRCQFEIGATWTVNRNHFAYCTLARINPGLAPRLSGPAGISGIDHAVLPKYVGKLHPTMCNPIRIIRSTTLPVEAACTRLQEVAAAHKFGVQAVHNLREKMESKGVPFGRECRVIEVCNPHHAQVVLNQNIEISTALPCRISVYEDGGRTILATIKPTALLTMFNAPGAAATAQEVEDTMIRIMDETCRT